MRAILKNTDTRFKIHIELYEDPDTGIVYGIREQLVEGVRIPSVFPYLGPHGRPCKYDHGEIKEISKDE